MVNENFQSPILGISYKNM